MTRRRAFTDELVTITETYTRVYQGHHHDVYCDGERHLWVSGHRCGTAKLTDPNERVSITQGICDCCDYPQSRSQP